LKDKNRMLAALRVFGESVLIALAKRIGLLLWLFAIVASLATFTPAVLLAFGPMVYPLSSVAIAISPLTDMDEFGHSIALVFLYSVPVFLGFGGIYLGVHRLQRCHNT
jgi:hypothetical protein